MCLQPAVSALSAFANSPEKMAQVRAMGLSVRLIDACAVGEGIEGLFFGSLVD